MFAEEGEISAKWEGSQIGSRGRGVKLAGRGGEASSKRNDVLREESSRRATS